MASLLQTIRAAGQPDEHLFAVLDAAQSADVLTLLHRFDAPTRSLYQGASEAQLGNAGPHLVELSGHDDLLKSLLRRGWGNAWGIFVASRAPFKTVRKHFRTLMMVRRASDGTEMYFRFYDPRVLRLFLPTCSPEQAHAMFGPLSAFWIEDASGAVIRFQPNNIKGERIAGDV